MNICRLVLGQVTAVRAPPEIVVERCILDQASGQQVTWIHPSGAGRQSSSQSLIDSPWTLSGSSSGGSRGSRSRGSRWEGSGSWEGMVPALGSVPRQLHDWQRNSDVPRHQYRNRSILLRYRDGRRRQYPHSGQAAVRNPVSRLMSIVQAIEVFTPRCLPLNPRGTTRWWCDFQSGPGSRSVPVPAAALAQADSGRGFEASGAPASVSSRSACELACGPAPPVSFRSWPSSFAPSWSSVSSRHASSASAFSPPARPSASRPECGHGLLPFS